MRAQNLLALNSSSLEVAELLKLVLKTFWSATFMGVPAVLLRSDQFNGWTGCFLELIRRPVPQACPLSAVTLQLRLVQDIHVCADSRPSILRWRGLYVCSSNAEPDCCRCRTVCYNIKNASLHALHHFLSVKGCCAV